jgi:hypothetical protein
MGTYRDSHATRRLIWREPVDHGIVKHQAHAVIPRLNSPDNANHHAWTDLTLQDRSRRAGGFPLDKGYTGTKQQQRQGRCPRGKRPKRQCGADQSETGHGEAGIGPGFLRERKLGRDAGEKSDR